MRENGIETSDDPLMLILAELKSVNRTLRILASHLMERSESPSSSDELPQRLPEPFLRRLREMEPDRREHLLSELRKAGDPP
jgi:hypothetical protein